MANNTGLDFDPTRTIYNTPLDSTTNNPMNVFDQLKASSLWGSVADKAFEQQKQMKQSIPTISTDYHMPIQPVRLKPYEKPLHQWDQSDLDEVAAFNQKHQETQEQLAALNDWLGKDKFHADATTEDWERWNEGLKGLDDEEYYKWKDENYEKTIGKDEDWQDRLWRNQEFVKTFGIDAFREVPNAKDRDNLYQLYLSEDALKRKYGNNSNFEELIDLSPEGRINLIKAGYKSDAELEQENKENTDKRWLDYSLSERWNAITSDANFYAREGMTIGTVGGAAMAGGVGSIVGMAVDGLVGIGYGGLKGILRPQDADQVNSLERIKDNESILNKVFVSDSEHIKEDSQKDIADLQSKYFQAYQQGVITSKDIDSMFDQMALNGERTYTDEFGNAVTDNYTGSNYYSTFKDSDEFEHFNTSDKLKYLAQTEVLKRKYGQRAAMRVLDQDMQQYVSDHQTGWDWVGNTLKNVGVGGVANIMNKVVGIGALGARVFYGEEGLANYLEGKDASGSGEENWLNPQYWNKVDQYNTFDKDAIAQADKNGGVSLYNNVYTPGTEGDFWSWSTLNEALKMNKFAWSDLFTNIGLAKIVKGATRLAGGVEIAPGVLATESSAASKVINKAGAFGIMNTSSLGIDVAYGMQTYEDVLNENNRKLDAIIEKDTEEEVKRRLQTPEALQEFQSYVAAENERRRQRAGENNPYLEVDEAEAYKDYVRLLTRRVREEQEVLHAEDRQQARNDAANAFAADATIEHLRMATTNGVFKSYLFDKGTLNALKMNNPFVNTTTKNGLYTLGQNASKKKWKQVLGLQIWGGAQSNYFDDVTVGFAEGLGIQNYNNYLLQKYNPASYGNVIDDYVNPFLAGMMGAVNATGEGRSFLDGAIGGLGTFVTVSPNIHGMMSHRERMKQLAESLEKSGDKKGIHWSELLSDYINSPIIEAIAQSKQATRMTDAAIKRANDAIKENAYALDHIGETLSVLNQKAATREGTSVMEAEDAKDKEVFNLASSLLALKNNGAVVNAQAEPDKANWSRKKKIARAITDGLNTLMGMPFFETAESSYTRAMQTLEDAASLDNTDNAEQQERQQSLINTFLGLDANKNVLKGMTSEEQVAFAKERLKKNATGLLSMMDKIEKVQQKFDQSIASITGRLHPDVQQQLLYQYVLDPRMKERFSDLEKQITKEDNPTTVTDRESLLTAKYGSMAGLERVRKSQEKKVEQAEKFYEKAQQDSKKENDPTKSTFQNAIEKSKRYLIEKTAKELLEKEKAKLKEIEADKESLKELPVVKAEQILRLTPDERLRMLDDFYRNDYSEEQQKEIDKAKNLLIADGTPINHAMEMVRDAAILNHRIEDNMESAKKIMQNPTRANELQQALVENRKRAIIDYFNDKIVAEAFNRFKEDPVSTTTEQAVVEKVKNLSTAVLNGMQKEASQEMRRNRNTDDLSDATLDNIINGINTVLNERKERAKNVTDLDSYVRKTKKVTHTETKPVVPVFDQSTGEVVGFTSEEEVTTDRELSENDRKLIDYALDYAAEKGLSVEALPEQVGTKEFDNYIEERNHSYQLGVSRLTGMPVETNVGTAENRANPVSHDYMKSLMEDVIKSYNINKEETKQVKEDKQTSVKPQSVANPPVETKGDKIAGEKRGDEVKDTSNPLGIQKAPATPIEETQTAEETNPRNKEIIEKASNINADIIKDLHVLLNEIDGLNVAEGIKNTLKDTVESLVSQTGLKDIKDLQQRLYSDLGNSQADLANSAWQLSQKNITAKRKALEANKPKKQEGEKDNKQKTRSSFSLKESPLVLETIDFDTLVTYFKDFVDAHHIDSFLQKLYNTWQEDWSNKGHRHQAQAVFIYDPTFAGQIENSMRKQGRDYQADQDAPVIMALEITDANRDLIEEESQLIYIKDVPTGRSHYYQPLGLMPSNTFSEKGTKERNATAERMGAIRSRIEYNDKKGEPLKGPTIIRVKPHGTPIQANLNKPSVDVTEDNRPSGNAEVPKTNVSQLMENNMTTPSERFETPKEEDIREYEDTKKKGLLGKLRSTKLYKKMRDLFIDRIEEVEVDSKDDEEASKKALVFNIRKGTDDTFQRPIFTRPIGDKTPDGQSMMSYDRNNPSRTIVSMLRDIDAEGESSQEALTKADELLESNSRFKRLFKSLASLVVPEGLLTEDGQVAVKNYDEQLHNYAKAVEKAIDNNFNVDGLSVETDITDASTFNIRILSGNEVLAAVSLPYKPGTKIDKLQFASIMKHLILGEDGNTRQGLRDPRYERVKWQVTYKDANATSEVAKDNLRDLYDDNVLVMQETKLAYPAKTISVGQAGGNLHQIYSDVNAPMPTTNPVTETKAAFEAETKEGNVDGDSGAFTEPSNREEVLDALPQEIKDTVDRMISNSKERNIDPTNKNWYNILGQIWSRVTSIKYAMEGLKDRFNPESGWALPSSMLGDSFDEFGRDVFNGLYNALDPAKRLEEFDTYENSTKENYEKSYQALKAFETRLLKKGQIIIRTGISREDPGKITTKGVITATIKTDKGIENKKVRVAGTVDVLAIDRQGRLHIYDFKTHRAGSFTKNDAINKGYDRQLSMYAAFLEKEYGLPVASINIIPIKVSYETPDGINNDGTPIEHPEKHYKPSGVGNQLMYKDATEQSDADGVYEEFKGANFQVEEEFDLTKLTGDKLLASYDKMTADEKAAMEEALKDQDEGTAIEELQKKELVKTAPEVAEKEALADEDRDGFQDVEEGFSFFDNDSESKDTSGITEDTALDEIDPENSLKKKIDEQKKGCGKI